MPTTRVRRFISPISRSITLVVSTLLRCSLGNSCTDRVCSNWSRICYATHDTVEADRENPPIFSGTFLTLRVDTPTKYISTHATNNARSLRCHLPKNSGE